MHELYFFHFLYFSGTLNNNELKRIIRIISKFKINKFKMRLRRRRLQQRIKAKRLLQPQIKRITQINSLFKLYSDNELNKLHEWS